jgi:ElaB/YqjD/DUF883 family membrane-anchored ribosome-binding protein
LDSLVALYSFTDIAKNSGPPYFVQVDLPTSLAAIKANVLGGGYSSDYIFQSDIMRLFNGLNDAHTNYRAPEGYNCDLRRPYHPVFVTDEEGARFVFEPGSFNELTDFVWQTGAGMTPSLLFGKAFFQVNGMPAMQYFENFAQSTISNYKDPSVRFNAALRKDWMAFSLRRFPIMDSNMDYVTSYLTQTGWTAVPNLAYCSTPPSSTDSVISRNHESPEIAYVIPDHTKNGLDVHRERQNELQRDLDKLIASLSESVLTQATANHEQSRKLRSSIADIISRNTKTIHLKDQQASQQEQEEAKGVPKILQAGKDFISDPSKLTVISQAPDLSAIFMSYAVGGSQPVYILKVSTFLPTAYEDYIGVILSAFQLLQSRKASNLIIDVQNNGGGVICFANAMLTLLTPLWSLDPGVNQTLPIGHYDFRQSAVSDYIRTTKLSMIVTTDLQFLNASTNKPFASNAMYKPRLVQRGGSYSNYTQQGLFPAHCSQLAPFIPKPIYYVPNVLVLTDGACGSSCALFLTQLQTHKIAKTLSFGGPVGAPVPLSTSSFAGGNVFSYNMIADESVWLGDPKLPQPFPTTAFASWNMNELYASDNLNVPREFLKKPADFHLDYWATLFDDSTSEGGKTLLTILYTSAMSAVWGISV